jgi:hypothetical protein
MTGDLEDLRSDCGVTGEGVLWSLKRWSSDSLGHRDTQRALWADG